MTSPIKRIASFAGRHWLRLLIVGGALFLLSEKQVNFNVRLGTPGGAAPEPAAAPAAAPAPPAAAERPVLTDDTPAAGFSSTSTDSPTEKAGFFDRFRLFGADEPSAYDQLTRLPEERVAAFLRRFSNVAQAEQEKFGIPASVILANALLHGRAGEAPAAKQYENFFALPCGDDWPGATGRINGRCLRAYENAWTSFRDHSLYVTSGAYAGLTQYGETDYRRWAAGLEEIGFNDTDELAGQLTRTIDRYQLFRFD